MTDITKDVQYYLQNSEHVQELVIAPYIGSDDGWVNGWIFDSKLSTRIENSQRCAIVISYAGGSDTPIPGNSASFPAIVVDIWADPTRDADHSVIVDDAKTKCFTIHEAVKKALHLPNSQGIVFDETRITSSELLGEPELNPVIDGNGAKMLRARYGISFY